MSNFDPGPGSVTATSGDAAAVGVREVASAMHAATRRAVAIRRRRAEIKTEDAALGSELVRLIRRVMPDLLAEMGTSVWETDGYPVKIVTRVTGTMSKAPDLEAAAEYLIAQGFGGALKTTVAVEFSEDERDAAAALAAALASSLGKTPDVDRAVHPKTLGAWASEQLREGKPIALDVLGLSAWREAHVTIKGEKGDEQ